MIFYIAFYTVLVIAMSFMDYFKRVDLLEMYKDHKVIDPSYHFGLTVSYM